VKDPLSIKEAMESLKQGKALVVERSETGAKYIEFCQGIHILTEYNNLGDLLSWKELKASKLKSLLTEIINRGKDV